MNTDQHILSAFDRDLEAVQALIMKMGGMVEAALEDAATALVQRDAELASRVRLGDKAIDTLEEQVHAECARLIALRSPTATDLRTVLSVMRIASSLERCGDYAKNLAKRATVLVQMSPVGGSSASIARMAKSVQVLLKEALDAFIHRDARSAHHVRQSDQEVDQFYNAIFRELLTHMMEDPRNITAAMHLHFIAKNIERVGDHATGIAEQVIYLVTGEVPEGSRPKADVTSMQEG